MVGIGISLVLHYAFAKPPTTRKTPQSKPIVYLTYGYIQDGIIYKNNSIGISSESDRLGTFETYRSGISSSHPILASRTISEEALRQYLGAKNSPLADYSSQILRSPYWSTIIAICTIEEYSCSVNPYGSNNLWGLMSHGEIIRYNSISDGLLAINGFLDKAYNNGRTTIESFRGWYCASECTNWESTVINTKNYLESLN